MILKFIRKILVYIWDKQHYDREWNCIMEPAVYPIPSRLFFIRRAKWRDISGE